MQPGTKGRCFYFDADKNAEPVAFSLFFFFNSTAKLHGKARYREGWGIYANYHPELFLALKCKVIII